MRRWLPDWRLMTWVVVIFNVIMLAWVVAGLASVADNCAGLAGSELELCEAGTAVGATVGVAALVFLWAAGDVILGILWLVTRPRRTCPVCASRVRKGLTVCPSCGHDFRPSGAPA